MTAEQPDLFGEHDAAQQERDRLRQPATCPACGTRERTLWHVGINHGEASFPGGRCVAQHLTANHIWNSARRGGPEQLARDRARGIALGLDVDAIETDARAAA